MVKVRTAKAKGSSHEMDCYESLLPEYPDIYLTKQKGFQLMYDLQSDSRKSVFESKRLKGMSWNQAVKYYEKLEEMAPKGYSCYLLFKSNHQPCLVMSRHDYGWLQVNEFESEFGCEFVKHKPVQRVNRK